MTAVVVFSGVFCPKCNTLKRLLEEEGIEYLEKDVMKNMEEAKQLGIRTVPTTVVGNSDGFGVSTINIVTGVDIKRIKELMRGV